MDVQLASVQQLPRLAPELACVAGGSYCSKNTHALDAWQAGGG